jgi:hypothetical protein
MIRRMMVALVLAAGVLLAGLASPAHADERSVTCTAEGYYQTHLLGSIRQYEARMHGTAYYRPASNSPLVRQWTGYRVEIDQVKHKLGDGNRVDFRVYEDRELAFSRSVIGTEPGTRSVQFTRDVLTTSMLIDNTVDFQAEFDLVGASNPRCRSVSTIPGIRFPSIPGRLL